MSDERVRLQQSGSIAELVLTRGERGNALDLATAEQLRDAVVELTSLVPAEAAAVLLRAEGPHFCVGGDLRAFMGRGAQTREFVQGAADLLHEAVLGLTRLPVPLVVAVQGAVAGAGLGFALTGDIVVAARSARFRMAYTAVGLTPDCGTTWLLPRAVGRQRALDLTLTNRTLDADEAMAWGLVSRVVDEADLRTSSHDLTAELAAGAGEALRVAKALLAEGTSEPDLETHLVREAASIAAMAGTAKAQEAISSFFSR
jgi:2-(1,2-epoxy-1,2-dihydrophenyl)acetyl-CoA isomerase